MKFCWTTIYVKNMDESLRFYQEIVGLKLDRHNKISPEFELAFLGSGETQVELIWDKNKSDIQFGKDISLGFQAESLEEMIELLNENNIPILAKPIQPNPTIRFMYILDPNGAKIQFVQFLN